MKKGPQSFFMLYVALVLGGMSWFFNRSVEGSEGVSRAVSEILSDALHQAEDEAVLVKEAIAGRTSWPETRTAFYYFDSGRLQEFNRYWLDPPPVYAGVDSVFLVQTTTGKFLLDHMDLDSGRVLVSVLPLISGNPSLERFGSPWLFADWPLQVCGSEESGCFRVAVRENLVLRFSLPFGYRMPSNIQLAVLLFFLALFFFIWQLIRIQRASGFFLVRFLQVLVGLIVLRWFMIHTGVLGTWEPLRPWFDSSRFASSFVNDSPGNLLLNALCLMALAIVISHGIQFVSLFKTTRLKSMGGWFAMTGTVLMILLALMVPGLWIDLIYNHSHVSLDLSVSAFADIPRFALLASVLVIGMSVLVFVYGLYRLLLVFPLIASQKMVLVWGLASVVFAFFSVYFNVMPVVELMFLLVVPALLLLVRRIRPHGMVTRRQALISVLALLVGFLISDRIRVRELARQREDVERFLVQWTAGRDPVTEFRLARSAENISGDLFVQIVLKDPLRRKEAIVEKVKAVHLDPFLLQAGPVVACYDAGGRWMAGDGLPLKLDDLLSDFTGDSTILTSVVKYAEPTIANGFQSGYLALIPIGQLNAGWVAVLLRRYPEWNFGSNAGSAGFGNVSGHAVLVSGRIVFARGEPDYSAVVESDLWKESKGGASGFTFGGRFHLAFPHPSIPNGFVLASGPLYPPAQMFTNLSAFLLSVVLAVFLMEMAQWYLGARQGIKLSYASRLRVYLLAAFLLPLFSISVVVIRQVGEQRLKDLENGQVLDLIAVAGELERLPAGDSTGIRLRDFLSGQSRIHRSDFAAYDGAGRRMAFSSVLAPVPLTGLSVLQKTKHAQAPVKVYSVVGQSGYQAFYLPVHPGNLVADVLLLASVDFNWRQEQEQVITEDIGLVLDVALPVFVLFLVLTQWMVFRLTMPLRSVGVALRKTSLMSQGEQLTEDSGEDDMGRMVRSYNQLILNLENSRRELAQRERETAWREMARRVAHEIRNPLTPIRLTLQRLYLQIREGRFRPESSQAALEGVLQQTDVLADIANSFSSLAHQSEWKQESFDCIPVLRDAVVVFGGSDSGRVLLHVQAQQLAVSFDRNFLLRVINNLISNALQSGGDKSVEVIVSVRRDEEMVLMEIADNGMGMSAEVCEKIFQPYFTTRKKGTGLGLSIVRQGLEQAGGRIAVQSKSGHGTTMRVWIPAGR